MTVKRIVESTVPLLFALFLSAPSALSAVEIFRINRGPAADMGYCLLRRPAPDAAAEGGDVDERLVPRVEGDALGAAERQTLQGLPGPAGVLAQPEAGLVGPLVDAHVDPVRPARVDGRAEAVVGLAGDPLPGLAAVGRLVQAALLVADEDARGAQVDDPAVARVDVVV